MTVFLFLLHVITLINAINAASDSNIAPLLPHAEAVSERPLLLDGVPPERHHDLNIFVDQLLEIKVVSSWCCLFTKITSEPIDYPERIISALASLPPTERFSIAKYVNPQVAFMDGLTKSSYIKMFKDVEPFQWKTFSELRCHLLSKVHSPEWHSVFDQLSALTSNQRAPIATCVADYIENEMGVVDMILITNLINMLNGLPSIELSTIHKLLFNLIGDLNNKGCSTIFDALAKFETHERLLVAKYAVSLFSHDMPCDKKLMIIYAIQRIPAANRPRSMSRAAESINRVPDESRYEYAHLLLRTPIDAAIPDPPTAHIL